MLTRAKTRLAGAFSATLVLPFCAAGTSAAQGVGQVANSQLQIGDVFSTQTLVVEDAWEGVSGAATAVGSIASATGAERSIHVESEQELRGRVEASVDARVSGASGPYFVTSADATGASLTAGSCCAATTGSSLQTIQSGAVVSADLYGYAGKPADAITAEASAVGSTTGWVQNGGGTEAWTGQTNDGLVSATNRGIFAGTPGTATFTATAVANNVTGDITEAGADLGAGQTTSGPGTNALVDVRLTEAVDIQALASGVGNNIDVQAAGSTVDLNASQRAGAPVSVSADLQAGTWYGEANVVAYGVGNSTILSASGPRAAMWTEQTSAGPVTVTSAFSGGAGEIAYASATAMGNAVSGYGCSGCGGDLGATNAQIGNAHVRATSTIAVSGRARRVSGDATAVGNSATYQVIGSGQ